MKCPIIVTTYSPSFKELTDITTANKRDYAARHGYGVLEVPFADGAPSFRWGYHNLLKLTLHQLQTEHPAMIIDADAFITNPEVKIEDRLFDDDNVVIAREPAPNSPINCGVMLFNPTEAAKAYLRWLIATVDDWMEEVLIIQGWTEKHLATPVVSEALRIVEPWQMNAIPEERPEFPHKKAGEVWKDGDWIAHAYGFGFEKKLEFARKLCPKS